MKTLDQHIEEVMDWFDFRKAHEIMEHMDWKWHNESVPEIADMRKLVRKYMKELHERWKNEVEVNSYTGSGGFMIFYNKGVEDGQPWDHYRVGFYLEEWYTGL